jgi:hypothetical protein
MTDDDNTFVQPAPGAWGAPLSVRSYEITTLRDQFAMAALTGLCTDPDLNPLSERVAEHAYRLADAMMGARR